MKWEKKRKQKNAVDRSISQARIWDNDLPCDEKRAYLDFVGWVEKKWGKNQKEGRTEKTKDKQG